MLTRNFRDDALRCTHDVGVSHTAVAVDEQAGPAKLDCEALGCLRRHFTQKGSIQKSRNRVGSENTAGWIERGCNVVCKHFGKNFLGWLVAVIWDLLKGLVCRNKDSAVDLGRVQQLHNLIKLIYKLGKLGCILAFVNQLIHGQVRWVMRVVRIMRLVRALPRSMMRVILWVFWTSGRTVRRVVKIDVINMLRCRFERIRDGVDRIVKCIVRNFDDALEAVSQVAQVFLGMASSRKLEAGMIEYVSTVVGLNCYLVHHPLIWNNEGRGQCRKGQDGVV